MERLKDDDVLFVMSDHGFKSFSRCVNVNTWLVEHGYMRLKSSTSTGADYFGDVDWSKTKAFSVGMGGIFLNIAGRESQGIVKPEEVPKLKREIEAKLLTLRDHSNDNKPVRKVYDGEHVYTGPYKTEAPDLFIGWEAGYRVSWESVTGKLKTEIFEDNTKAWSGDHCVDADIVPGVLFSNRKIAKSVPRMVDIAPTILSLFDVEIPSYIEGKALRLL